MIVATALIADRVRQSILIYNDVREAKSTLEKNVQAIRGQLAELKEEHTRLTDDLSYYEQLGREELGMIRPDELVFIVPLRD